MFGFTKHSIMSNYISIGVQTLYSFTPLILQATKRWTLEISNNGDPKELQNYVCVDLYAPSKSPIMEIFATWET